jgi:hypothetical protein
MGRQCGYGNKQIDFKRNGMTCMDRLVKHYRGVDMPHLVYFVKRISKA